MEDCFAYKRNSCTALKVKQCEGCSFYKTKEQFEFGVWMWRNSSIFLKNTMEVKKHECQGIFIPIPVA